MCLLIAGTASQIRNTILQTEGLAADIYSSNSDGIGAMFLGADGLMTPKWVPKNLGEFIKFIEFLPEDDRQLALHARFKTHGDTDLENCHPYDVIEGRIAMMHNGVLSQGNKADVSKSDTWHYINDVIRPMLVEAPGMMLNPAWTRLVEEDIGGGNRFALMDSEGNLTILNKHTGRMVDGMWFSNTYAWSPELLIPGYKKSYAVGSWRGHHNYLADYEDEDDGWSGRHHAKVGGKKKDIAVASSAAAAESEDEIEIVDFTIDDLCDAIHAGPVSLAEYLDERPIYALSLLFNEFEFVGDYQGGKWKLDDYEKKVVELLEREDIHGLYEYLTSGEANTAALISEDPVYVVAECICWYGQFMARAINDKREYDEAVLAAAEAEVEEAIREFETTASGNSDLDYSAG